MPKGAGRSGMLEHAVIEIRCFGRLAHVRPCCVGQQGRLEAVHCRDSSLAFVLRSSGTGRIFAYPSSPLSAAVTKYPAAARSAARAR